VIGPALDFGPFRLSSDAIPERDRITAWLELYGRKILRLEHEPLSDREFRVDVTVRMLPGLAAITASLPPLRLGRTRRLLDDGNDNVTLQISSGRATAVQLGRSAELTPDDALVMSNADVGWLTFPAAAESVVLSLPRVRIAELVRDLDGILVQPLPAKTGALSLLRRYLALLEGAPALASPELAHLAVAHVYDLVAMALGATRDAAEIAAGRGIRAARLQAIKADIRAHPGEQGLSLDAVAAREGISSVYIRKLFEGEDTSFSKFVLEQRLARAHRLLSDPRFAQRTIAALALEAGFGDLSYFNRTFRRRFGASPSDVRAAATGGS
jgi:AraC-like DNA-binding protein